MVGGRSLVRGNASVTVLSETKVRRGHLGWGSTHPRSDIWGASLFLGSVVDPSAYPRGALPLPGATLPIHPAPVVTPLGLVVSQR